MKRIFITFLSLAMLVLCVSCSKGNTGTLDKVNTDISTLPNGLPPRETPTPAELEEEYEQFIKLIKDVTAANKEHKIGIINVSDYSSSNPKVITKWVELLQHLQISAIPYKDVVGSMSYLISFTTNIEKIRVGYYTSDHRYIYLDFSHGRKVMFLIDNYKEIEDEFTAAEKAIVFEKASE